MSSILAYFGFGADSNSEINPSSFDGTLDKSRMLIPRYKDQGTQTQTSLDDSAQFFAKQVCTKATQIAAEVIRHTSTYARETDLILAQKNLEIQNLQRAVASLQSDRIDRIKGSFPDLFPTERPANGLQSDAHEISANPTPAEIRAACNSAPMNLDDIPNPHPVEESLPKADIDKDLIEPNPAPSGDSNSPVTIDRQRMPTSIFSRIRSCVGSMFSSIIKGVGSFFTRPWRNKKVRLITPQVNTARNMPMDPVTKISTTARAHIFINHHDITSLYPLEFHSYLLG